MFEVSPIVQQAKANLVALGLSASYGQEFSFDELKTRAGVVTKQEIYALVPDVNEDLLQQKRMFANVRSRGYKICNPNEHIDQMEKRKGRAVRQLQSGFRIGEGTAVELLTPDQQAQLFRQMAKFAADIVQVRIPAEKALKRQKAALQTQQLAVNEQQQVVDRIKTIEREISQLKKGIGIEEL